MNALLNTNAVAIRSIWLLSLFENFIATTFTDAMRVHLRGGLRERLHTQHLATPCADLHEIIRIRIICGHLRCHAQLNCAQRLERIRMLDAPKLMAFMRRKIVGTPHIIKMNTH
ncbi:MAG: hypothetical protein ACK424_05380 [Candidatus Thermochlorobacter sp.]